MKNKRAIIHAKMKKNKNLRMLLFISIRPFTNLLSEINWKYSPTRTLRSSNSNLLIDKKYKECNYKSLGERSFAVSAPRLWNSLPVELRMAQLLHNFKILMKKLMHLLF